MKKCVLCDSDKKIFLLKGKDIYMKVDNKFYDLYQCLECKLTTLNPLPNHSELSKYYPSNYKIFLQDKNENNNDYLTKFKIHIIKFFKLNYLQNTLDALITKKLNDWICHISIDFYTRN